MILALLLACSDAPTPAVAPSPSTASGSAPLTLVYSGNNDGEYEPCG